MIAYIHVEGDFQGTKECCIYFISEWKEDCSQVGRSGDVLLIAYSVFKEFFLLTAVALLRNNQEIQVPMSYLVLSRSRNGLKNGGKNR